MALEDQVCLQAALVRNLPEMLMTQKNCVSNLAYFLSVLISNKKLLTQRVPAEMLLTYLNLLGSLKVSLLQHT